MSTDTNRQEYDGGKGETTKYCMHPRTLNKVTYSHHTPIVLLKFRQAVVG